MTILNYVSAYFLMGAVISGAMYGNDSLPPDLDELFAVVVFWPAVAVFFILCGFFALGALIARRFK